MPKSDPLDSTCPVVVFKKSKISRASRDSGCRRGQSLTRCSHERLARSRQITVRHKAPDVLETIRFCQQHVREINPSGLLDGTTEPELNASNPRQSVGSTTQAVWDPEARAWRFGHRRPASGLGKKTDAEPGKWASRRTPPPPHRRRALENPRGQGHLSKPEVARRNKGRSSRYSTPIMNGGDRSPEEQLQLVPSGVGQLKGSRNFQD